MIKRVVVGWLALVGASALVSRWVMRDERDERDDMYELCLPGGRCCDEAATPGVQENQPVIR